MFSLLQEVAIMDSLRPQLPPMLLQLQLLLAIARLPQLDSQARTLTNILDPWGCREHLIFIMECLVTMLLQLSSLLQPVHPRWADSMACPLLVSVGIP